MLKLINAWFKRKSLQAQLEEELQYQLDLQNRWDSLSQHMMSIDESITELKMQIAEANGGKIVTPPTQENDDAPRPRNVEEDDAEKHTH